VRLLIDMQGAQSASRFRGIGRYSLTLVQHLLRIAEGHEVLILLNGQLDAAADALVKLFLNDLPREHIVIFEPLPGVAWSNPANHWRARAMEPVREAFIAEHEPDVVLITSLFEGYHDDASTSVRGDLLAIPTAVVHYDLIPLGNPDYLQQESQRVFYRHKCQQLLSADLLLTISDASRQEVIDRLGMPAQAVTNISAAVAEAFCAGGQDSVTVRQALLRLGIQKPFVLYTPGGFDPRKNFERLIEAVAALPDAVRAQHQLVIPGKLDEAIAQTLTKTAARCGLAPDHLKLVGYVSDEDLRMLYRSTAVFVFPSLHEGFGLPVLEAMACGAPVIASNTSSLPEVVGNPDALFDPLDSGSIADKLARALTDPAFTRSLSDRGLKQVAAFSWEKTASRALAALEALAAQRANVKPSQSIQQGLSDAIHASVGEVLDDAKSEIVARCLANHFAFVQQPQFFIDVTELRMADTKTGIHRVVRSLLLAFLSSPPAGFAALPIYYDGTSFRHARGFLTAFHREGASAKNGGALSAKRTELADDIVDFCAGDVYLGLDFNVSSTPEAEDHLRRLSRRGVRLCFVVYDMLPLLCPQWWPPEMEKRFEAWLRCLSAMADTICCISAAVAQELEAWLQQAEVRVQHANPKIRHFHLGADLASSAPTAGWPPGYDEICERLGAGTTFLMVGTVEPRKGHAQVVAGFDELWAAGADVNLVILGKPGWMVADVMAALESHPQRGERLFWFEAASDECLEDLYARADCLIAASEGEGFGLPLIEAAQHGVPIIARDLPVFREVAGDGALYFNGPESAEIAKAVARWIPLFEEGTAPASTAIEWLTWRESALQLLAALELPSAEAPPTTPEEMTC
jgi:glycosyltransferase involved in cell wall biosynthesis